MPEQTDVPQMSANDSIWQMLAGLMEDDANDTTDSYSKLQSYLTGNNTRFRWDRNAQDMLTFAQLAKDMGDDSTSQQIMWQALSKGFRPSYWQPQGFGGLYNRWGLQYGGNQGK